MSDLLQTSQFEALTPFIVSMDCLTLKIIFEFPPSFIIERDKLNAFSLDWLHECVWREGKINEFGLRKTGPLKMHRLTMTINDVNAFLLLGRRIAESIITKKDNFNPHFKLLNCQHCHELARSQRQPALNIAPSASL